MNIAKRKGQRHTGSNRPYIQRYRARHKRIDYVPSVEALAIIDIWRARKLDNCTAGVIDRLIHAGHAALSGNADSTQAGSRQSTQHDIPGKASAP
jgi:hypothetical protein